MAVTCKYACDIPSIFYENKNYEIKKLGLKLTPFQAVLSLIHFRLRGLKLFSSVKMMWQAVLRVANKLYSC